MRGVFLLLLAALDACRGAGRRTPAFQPHYVSQRIGQASLREGPGYAYKILWVYRHKGYPFKEMARFDIWRRVTAADGTVGWLNGQLLSDARTVLVTGKDRAEIHKDAAPGFQAGGSGRTRRGVGAEKLRSRILPRPRRSRGWLDCPRPHLGRRSRRSF